jgi:electron transfer flavoprotein beta subunit
MNVAAGGRPLNILVLVKFVRDPNQLQADANGHPDLARAPFRISTFDDNAIEAALQLCGQHGGRVFGVSVMAGEPPPRDVLLRAMAMGLDALYFIRDEMKAAADPYRLAVALAAAARAVQAAEKIPSWDLLIAGEASADQFNAQIGPRVAAALDIPAIAHATKLEVQQDRLIVNRVTEENSETLEADFPALVTVGTEINQARIPTVLQVMGARNKPIREMPLSEVPGFEPDALGHGASLRTIDITAPPSSRKRIVVVGETPAEMAANLLSLLGADGEVKV